MEIFVCREKSADWVLRTSIDWEFPSCGTWKVRRNGWGRVFDVHSCYVLYMVHSRANVLV